MAMTTEEIRSGISNLCEKDNEMTSIHAYLDKVMDWPMNETFQLMVLIDELRKRMKDEVAHFTFRKKDGTVRQAYGTRVFNAILKEHTLFSMQSRDGQWILRGPFGILTPVGTGRITVPMKNKYVYDKVY